MKLAHISAQSLCDVAHYSEFCDDFANSGIDIIAVSETFFKDSSSTSLLNYIAHTVNRIDRNGGGVALYVKNNLPAKVLAMTDSTSGKPELWWAQRRHYVHVFIDHQTLIIWTCYLLIYTSHWLITNMFLCAEI